MAPRDLFQQPQRARRSPLALIAGLLVHSAAAGLMWLAFLPAALSSFEHQDFKDRERLTFLRATLTPVEVVRSARKTRLLEIPAAGTDTRSQNDRGAAEAAGAGGCRGTTRALDCC